MVQFMVDGQFVLLRPLYVLIFVFALIIFLMNILPRRVRQYLNGFIVVFVSLFTLVLSGMLLFFDAVLVDELVANGDSFATYFFVGTAILAIINPVIYFSRKKKIKERAGELH